MRLSRIDSILILAFMGCALYASFTLGWIEFKKDTITNFDFIAQVSETKNSVKKKSDGILSWSDAHNEDKLRLGDQLYTHEESMAEIVFKKGTKVSVSENSLFKIEQKDGKDNLNLKKGVIYLKMEKESPPLDLTIGEKSLSLTGSGATVQIDTTQKNNRITVLDGNINLTENGKELQIKENEEANFETGKETQVKKIDIIPQEPLLNSNLVALADQNIVFKFQGQSELTHYELEVSSNREFDKNLIIEKGNPPEIGRRLPSTNLWYWRIRGTAQSGEKVYSPIMSFNLKQVRPLTITNPSPNQNLYMNKDHKLLGLEKVEFVWEKEEYQSFAVTILKDDQKIIETKTDEREYHFEPKEIGAYLFRVKPIIENIENVPDASLPFKISESILPPDVEITSPTPNRVYLQKDSAPEKITFNWKPVSGIKNYILKTKRVDEDDDEAKIIKVEAQSYDSLFEKTGDYAFQVLAVDQFNQTSREPLWHHFKIVSNPFKNLTPTQGEKIELKTLDAEIIISFEKNDPNETTELTFWNNGVQIFAKEISGTSYKLSRVSPGNKSYQLRTLIGDRKIDSEKIDFSVTLPEKPSAPPIAPEGTEEIKIKIKKVKKSIESTWNRLFDLFIGRVYADEVIQSATIEWPKVEGAKKYRIQIFKDAGMKKTLLDKTSETNNLEWDGAMPGTIYWRVSTVDLWDQVSDYSPLKASNVVIDEEDQEIKSIEIVEPKNGTLITIDPEEDFKIEWEKDKRAKSYSILIATDKDFKNPLLEKESSGRSLKLKVNEIGEGERFFKISGRDQYDRIKNSKQRSFTIKYPAPILSIADTKKKSYLLISGGLNNITLTQSGDGNSIDASGSVYTGLKLNYLRTFDTNRSFIKTNLSRFTGKVFNSNFENSELTLSYGKHLKSESNHQLSYAGGIAYDRTTSITVSNQIATSSLTSDFSLRGELLSTLFFDRSEFHTKLTIGYPALLYSVGAAWLYGTNYLMGPNIEYAYKKKEIETKIVETTELKLLFSFGKRF